MLVKVSDKKWFSVFSTDKLEAQMIVCAVNEDAVRNVYGKMYHYHTVKPLSWKELHDITGCIIPVSKQPSEQADGYVMYRKNEQTYFVECIV